MTGKRRGGSETGIAGTPIKRMGRTEQVLPVRETVEEQDVPTTVVRQAVREEPAASRTGAMDTEMR